MLLQRKLKFSKLKCYACFIFSMSLISSETKFMCTIQALWLYIYAIFSYKDILLQSKRHYDNACTSAVFHQHSALGNRQAIEINKSSFFIIRIANRALTNKKDDSGPVAEENHPFNHKCRRCEAYYGPYITHWTQLPATLPSYDPDSTLVSGHI